VIRKKQVITTFVLTLFLVCAMGASWSVRSYLEDAPHQSKQKGQMILAVRNDALAALAGTDGDYAPFQVDANGALYTASAAGTALIGKVQITDGTDDVLVNASKELQVDDDAGTLLLGTIDADTGAIKTAVELTDHLTAANSGNKDAATQRVVLATDDINASAIKTSVEIIDNNALSAQTLLRQTFVSAALASDGVVTIVTDPAAATAPKIVALVFTQTVQGLAEVRVTGASGTILAQYYLPAYGGVALAMGEQPYVVGTANESIVIKNKTGAACSYAGHVVYYLE